MSVVTPATRALDYLGIPYRLFTHKKQPATLNEAAKERHQEPHQVIRSILFRLAQETYVLVLIAGPEQISWKKVRTHLGISRLSMATATEVRAMTGYEVGTVNPFGLLHPVRILADVNVLEPMEISIGCGLRGTAIIINSLHLKQALGNLEIGDFSGG